MKKKSKPGNLTWKERLEKIRMLIGGIIPVGRQYAEQLYTIVKEAKNQVDDLGYQRAMRKEGKSASEAMEIEFQGTGHRWIFLERVYTRHRQKSKWVEGSLVDMIKVAMDEIYKESKEAKAHAETKTEEGSESESEFEFGIKRRKKKTKRLSTYAAMELELESLKEALKTKDEEMEKLKKDKDAEIARLTKELEYLLKILEKVEGKGKAA